LLVLLAIFASAMAAVYPATPVRAAESGNYDDGTILVGWKRSAPAEARLGVHLLEDAHVVNTIGSIDVDVVAVPEGQDVHAWVERYERYPNVAFAELNYRVRATSIPNDILFEDQWGFHNTAQSVTGSLVRGAADWDIDAPEAWTAAFGANSFPSSGGTRVAVIDTGIDRTHVDLLSKVKACASALAAIGVVVEGSCSDDNLHGTHVAGTVAAQTGNTAGVAGTAPNAELAIFKALNAAGVGFVGDIAAGIDWSWRKANAKIISMSLGSEEGTGTEERAVKEAAAAGVLVIAAAGNGYDAKPNYPAYYSEVMSVASFNQAGTISDFSTCNADVEIAAPGEDIWSSFPNNTYGVISGTSMATPHVAGAAALVMSELGLDASETRQKLKSTGVSGLSTGGRKECSSYPALNLAAAVGAGGTTTSPSTDPGTIAGKVYNQQNGSAISGATVDCGTAGKATTASSGTYSLSNVAPGGYTCTATASGFRSKSLSVTVSSNTVTTADFGLRSSSK
jgi:thermitase